jgi:hypothetical protein
LALLGVTSITAGPVYAASRNAVAPPSSGSPTPSSPSSRATKATVTAAQTTAGTGAGVTPGAVFEGKFVSMTGAARQAVMSQMANDGVHWLRIDVPSDFRFNAFIQAATSNGIHVDAVLQAWTTPLNASAFSRFATQAVQTLKPLGVETYEVLNEPNCDQYCLSASSYTRILKASYTSVKSADSTATVITAGMGTGGGSNEPYNYLTGMYKAGAQGNFDAFNMHPYSYPDTPLQTGDGWNPWSYLPELHAIMVAHGDGAKQIWLTEFGCPTGSDGGYTAYCTDSSLSTQIADAFSMARGWTWTGPLFVYNWIDDARATGDGDFGLYYANGAPKTATLSTYTLTASQ